MILYIIRHAWAADPSEPAWSDDRRRPLTEEGRKRFAAMVKKLAGRGFAPERIATSPLVRCVQTSQIIAELLDDPEMVISLDALAPESSLGELVTWTNRECKGCRQVAWVGHAPDVGEMTGALISGSRALVHFPKGAIAAVEFDGPVQPRAGELQWLVSAKVLNC